MNLNKDLIGVLSAPSGAASIVKRKLNKEGINASTAAHKMGINPSTLSRFFNGTDLSISLAAKLSHHFGFDIEIVLYQIKLEVLLLDLQLKFNQHY